MTKTYVLDTNVLLADPDSIFKFEDNLVILPATVLDELDTFKVPRLGKDPQLAINARRVARNLRELMKLGRLDQGIDLPKGGRLQVEVSMTQALLRLPLDYEENVADNRILSVAKHYNAIVVSNDNLLCIKAEAVGLVSQEYQAISVKTDELYNGTGRGYVSEDDLNRIYKEFGLPISAVTVPENIVYPNQCFTLVSMDNEKHTALARYDSVMKSFVLVPEEMKTLGLDPKNSEQHHALHLLHDPDIKLVSMMGKAGSGKTLLALAAAIYGVTVSKQYSKVLLLKPIVSMDNSHQLGFLPGSMEEKLAPWLSSYYDNIEYIMRNPEFDETPQIKKTRKKREQSYESAMKEKGEGKLSKAEELVSMGLLEIGSLEHIRGRSLPNQFIIIDEAQGLTHHAIKTIITRAGEGTKVVLMGDIEQIDLPYLSAENNGLVYVADKFKETTIAGHITLNRSVRSELAEMAAELL